MRLPSAEQYDFVASVEAILRKHDPLRGLRAGPGSRAPREDLWRDLETVGVLEPLDDGDVLTACLIAEALGRFAAPVPYLARTVGRAAIAALGGCSGDEEAPTFGFLSARGTFAASQLRLRGSRVDGRLPFVPDADISRAVVAITDTVPRAVVLRVADATPTALVTLDATQPMSALEFTGAAARVLPLEADALTAALARVRHLGTAIHCAGLVGAMSWLLDTTVAYVGQRVQFGQPIASRQAVKHACAEMLARVESGRALVLELADALAGGERDVPAELLVSTAKGFISEAAEECAARAFQLHGGIGFTWEYDLHHYFKRCVAGAALFGSAAHHRGEVAEALRTQLAPLT